MGAPVYDEATKTYVGMFDTRDILSCVTAAHREFLTLGGHHKPGEDTTMPHDVEAHHKTQRELIAKALQDIKIDTKPPSPGAVTVSYLAARNPIVKPVTKDTPLLEICKVMGGRHKHRVPITEEDASGTPVCTGIISQSGLVVFIASKCPQGSMDEKMTDAGLGFKKDVVEIVDTESAACAFELLDSKRLSGIAVVDEDGKLIGNTSARDVKIAVMDEGRTGMVSNVLCLFVFFAAYMFNLSFWFLCINTPCVLQDIDILSYLAKVRQSQLIKNDKYPSCHIHEDATVRQVVNLLAKTGFHRVFVVDENIKPTGVVSFADIINFFIENGEK